MTINRIQGPNVKKLIVRRMSQLAISPSDGLLDVIEFLLDSKKIIKTAQEATKWVWTAIDVVKTAPDNPYGDDESIAKAILDKIEEREN